tara:strand:+ start:10873 stop:11277 length:405 start_codon:yes stop_codon:yes gene_type:complete
MTSVSLEAVQMVFHRNQKGLIPGLCGMIFGSREGLWGPPVQPIAAPIEGGAPIPKPLNPVRRVAKSALPCGVGHFGGLSSASALPEALFKNGAPQPEACGWRRIRGANGNRLRGCPMQNEIRILQTLLKPIQQA